MALCNFCRRAFRNSQAVRAHLRHCKKYRGMQLSDGEPRQGLPSIQASTGQEGTSTQPSPTAFELHVPSRRRNDFKGLTKTHVHGLLWCYEKLGDLLADLAMNVKLDRMLSINCIGAGAPTEE